MYLRTVRGEIWIPSLSNSSLAMRSSPQDGLSRAIARMSARNSAGIRGRPGRDFQRQNRRNPARCQPMKVLGVTFVSVYVPLESRGYLPLFRSGTRITPS